MLSCGGAGNHKNPCADDLADAEHDEMSRPERAMKPVLLRYALIDIGMRLC